MTTKSIGIIAAPGILDNVSEHLKERLSNMLSDESSDGTKWDVEIIVDSLTGSAETQEELYEETLKYESENDWDHIVTVTDLPLYEGDRIIAVDINQSGKKSIISTPPYGWPPIKKKILHSIISIIKILDGSSKETEHKNRFKKFFPTSKLQYAEETYEDSGDKRLLYYLNDNIRGTLRLAGGMSWMNNPFNMMRSLSGVIAIAFATGAFGLIFSTMWNLSFYFPVWRLVAVSSLAIIGMVLWIIISHSLWEKVKESEHKKLVKLYNRTTILTLCISLVFYFIILYLMFLGAGLVLLPSDYVSQSIGVGSIGLSFYFKLAWFVASVATVAGAIGAGIQDNDLIRESTYGYRQRFRYERASKSDE